MATRRGRTVLVPALAVLLAAVAGIALTGLHRNAFADEALSAGKAATASSVNGANTAAKAVDGDGNTRWESKQGVDPQWLQVDLGAAKSLGRVDLVWERAAAKAYELQISNDAASWQTVFSTTTGKMGAISVPVTGTARYVRMLGTARTTQYGYSLYEFQVFGSTGTATTTPTTPAATGGVSGLELVDNTAKAAISQLTDGSTIDVGKLPDKHVSVRASLASASTVGSVAFKLTGAKGTSHDQVQNEDPYFLCNDFGDCPQLVAADSYTLVVQAYAKADGKGDTVGPAVTVHFQVVAGGSTTTPAPPASTGLDVLFIGNSLLGTRTSATNQDTPDVVKSLATKAGKTLNVTEVIHFGNTLQQTWDAGEVKNALSGSKKYDFIVLQEQSTLVSKSFSSAEKALLDTYAPAVSPHLKSGGKVLLFENWALADNAGFDSRAANVATIKTNYAKLAGELTVPNKIIPISDAFEKVIAGEGPSSLMVSDGKHPNDKATYLDAATIYGTFFNESPKNLDNLYLSADKAAQMRGVAAGVLGF